MSNHQDNWAVGLVHEVCPICTAKMNEQIIIPKRLSKPVKEQIEEMHNKAIDIADEPCAECKEHIENGFVAIIGIDVEKSNPNRQNETVTLRDIYRTGLVWLRKEVVHFTFPSWVEAGRKEPFILIEDPAFQHLMNQINQLEERNPDDNEKSQSTEE